MSDWDSEKQAMLDVITIKGSSVVLRYTKPFSYDVLYITEDEPNPIMFRGDTEPDVVRKAFTHVIENRGSKYD